MVELALEAGTPVWSPPDRKSGSHTYLDVQPTEAQQVASGWGIDQTMVLWRTFGVSIAWWYAMDT